MTLFWIGIIIFFIGAIVRYCFKSKYYNAYIKAKQAGNDPVSAGRRYRPFVVIGGALQILGCIVGLSAFFFME